MYVSSIDACTNPTQIKSSRRVPLPIGRSVKLARGDRCMTTAQLTAASALMRMPSTTCGDSGRAWLNSERERAAAVRAMPADQLARDRSKPPLCRRLSRPATMIAAYLRAKLLPRATDRWFIGRVPVLRAGRGLAQNVDQHDFSGFAGGYGQLRFSGDGRTVAR